MLICFHNFTPTLQNFFIRKYSARNLGSDNMIKQALFAICILWHRVMQNISQRQIMIRQSAVMMSMNMKNSSIPISKEQYHTVCSTFLHLKASKHDHRKLGCKQQIVKKCGFFQPMFSIAMKNIYPRFV